MDRAVWSDALGTLHDGVTLKSGAAVWVWLLSPKSGVSPTRLRAMAESARKAAAVAHPVFAHVLSVLSEEDRLCLVLERPGGRPVSELLGVSSRASPYSAIELLRCAAEALDCAHARGVVHGHLSPSNLLLAPEGAVRISGLGVPRAAEQAFQAPEQAFGPPSSASDVFGLSACAYALLTGRAPFPGPDYAEQKRRMLLEPLSKAAEGLSMKSDMVLRRGMAPDPSLRFRSCVEFISALRGASAIRRRSV